MNLRPEFAWPLAFLALALPWVVRYVLPPASASGGALRVPARWLSAAVEAAPSAERLQRLVALLCWVLLVAAAARPQLIGEPVTQPRSGRDLMVAVDISGSMQETDLQLDDALPATRLDVVKHVLGQFLERRQGDRVGLILFGRQAYVLAPYTFDLRTVAQLLNESEIGLAGKETAIGDAIGLAAKRADPEQAEEQVLVLLTDGANTAGRVEPLKAAELAAQRGLKIYTIGVGADEMMVRSLFGARRINPSADLDEPTLRRIAQITGGRYFRARDTGELEQIYQVLDELEPLARDSEVYRPRAEVYHWPLGAALTLAGLALLARRLRGREGVGA